MNLAVLASINVILGFVYQWYYLAYLGPGRATDALVGAMIFPFIVTSIISGSLAKVLLPIFSTQNTRELRLATWTYMQYVGIGACGIGAVLIVTTSYWVPVVVPGVDGVDLKSFEGVFQILILSIFFSGVSSVQIASHQARRRFIRVEVVHIAGQMLALFFLYFMVPRMGIYAAAWGLVLRYTVQIFGFLYGLGGYALPDHKSAKISTVWRRLVPLLIGTSYYKLDYLVDRMIASFASPGALSLFHLISQLYSSAVLVMSRAIAGPVFPSYARLVRRRKIATLLSLVRQRAAICVGLGGIALLLSLVLGYPILVWAFSESQGLVPTSWYMLVAMVGMLVGGSAGQVVVNAFYAAGDTATPTIVGVVGFTVGVILKIAGFWFFGVVGLSVAISAYYLLNLTILTVLLKPRLKEFYRGAGNV